MKRLLNITKCMLGLLLCCPLTTHGAEDDAADKHLVIEQHGDSYVINVKAMEPDSEMTLLDVLQLCPEMVTTNGRDLSGDVIIAEDGFDLYMDPETVLQYVKASEISSITIYTNPCISKLISGSEGVIEITFKKDAQDSVHAKLGANGNSRGNGRVYADATIQRQNFSMKGYALANQHFGRGTTAGGTDVRNRLLEQDTHVNIDWDLSKRDNLKVKLDQQFTDSKQSFNDDVNPYDLTELNRLGSVAMGYTRTLNDNNATLETDLGLQYQSTTCDGFTRRDVLPYLQIEFNTPLVNDDLSLMVGYLLDYDNKRREKSHQHYLENDIYSQLSYSPGPWIFTLGTLLTTLNHWNHAYGADGKTSESTSEVSWVAVAGRHWGQHYLQATLQREFYINIFDDPEEDDEMDSYIAADNFQTINIWETELRHTYQLKNLTLMSNVFHEWTANTPNKPQQLTSIRSSCTWKLGQWRLTAGAGFYHHHIDGTDKESPIVENFVRLKLAPTLLLGKGFRVAASLIYNSRQETEESNGHLYASVKVNKDLGRRCNIFAEFQDMAGMPNLTLKYVDRVFYQRALNIGVTYRL